MTEENIKKEIKLAKVNEVYHKKHMEYFTEQIKILEKYLEDITRKEKKK